MRWSARAWSVGALLSLPIFDGGRREAALEQARAQLDADLARYRGEVLLAFREVEDQAGGQFPVQIAAPADVARDAEAGAGAAGMDTLGVVLGGAGLLLGLAALGLAFAGRRRAA